MVKKQKERKLVVYLSKNNEEVRVKKQHNKTKQELGTSK